jgi:glucosamine kinase
VSIVIGVDGGGSKTHVIVADASGAELASAEGAGSAVRPGEVQKSAENIAALVRNAIESANVTETPAVLYAGLAGAGRERERRAIETELVSMELAEEVRVTTDAMVALSDAFGDGSGIILIAGTGSIAYGRGPTGGFSRCGGWGATFGDEGSGSWIGRRALAIVAAASDGREPATALTGAILTSAQLNEPEELIPWAIAASSKDLAELAPVVFATAMAGDLRANTLLNLAAEELVLHVRALGRRLFGDERASMNVAFAGGLLHKGSPLRKRVESRLKSAVPGALVRIEPVIPARGAVRAARHVIGALTGS